MKQRKCPVCGNKKQIKIYSMSFNMPETYGLPASYDIVCCEVCGFCYADTMASLEDYDLYYKNCNVYALGPDGAADKPNYEWLDNELDKLFGINKLNVHILDVGFGKGEFLEFLNKKCYKNIKGIDPAQESVDYTRKKGFDTYLGNIYNCDNKVLNKKIDFICLWEVLEHLLEPALALETLKIYLKEDGYVFIAAPDCGSISQDITPIVNNFNQEHINYFSKQSLNNLMSQHSFVNIVTECRKIFVNSQRHFGVILAIYKYTSKSERAGGGDL